MRDTYLKYDFLVLFPGGYRVRDLYNDNTDVYIVFKNDFSTVFVTTLFTTENINQIMRNNKESFFWASDMLILDNLSRETIYMSIDKIIKTDHLSLNNLFCIAGSYSEVFDCENIIYDLL
ncbi:hypothetical protein [Flavobacterium sp. GCM10027622]|uniref:hypothetical protein n=1 Tax=unclassified Flavobacterium TaxID=196869 RepID=UPI003620220C